MTQALAKSPGPGRPKDLEKRAAILEAAKRLFPQRGFDGTSMDLIAAAAGVSKLTVYSHFHDKETLYVEAIRAKCEAQMPATLFDVDLDGPLRRQLEAIALAFFELVTSAEAIALHRLLTAGNGASAKLGQMFWEAGPQRVQQSFAEFLRSKVDAGKLDLRDVERGAAQFFCLLKGEPHARLLCGCGKPFVGSEVDDHLHATVELFLRAYEPRSAR
ncbi:MAG: TetR/AcrR family transcriptional regulator [Rhodanobacteraceae bacterium]